MLKSRFFVSAAVLVLFVSMGAACSKKGPRSSVDTESNSALKRIHFDFDQYNIRSDAAAILKQNAASLISPTGKIIARYRKIHLFKIGSEEKRFSEGDKTSVIQTSIGKLGLAICFDIRFPEIIRKMVLKGAEILIIPSAWPKKRIDHYLTLLKARAIENQCFVLSANKVGKNSMGAQLGGNSIAYDPWGKVLGKMGEKEGVLEIELDLNQLHQIRKSFPVLKERREGVY